MGRLTWVRCGLLFALVFGGWRLNAGEIDDAAPGVVCHVSVLSDKVPDMSSLAAWKKAFIKDGMSDKDKGLAIWKSIITFKQQDQPPLEFLTGDTGDVHDVIKTLNVYGYGLCCCAASNVE